MPSRTSPGGDDPHPCAGGHRNRHHRGEPGYASHLDRDGDGVACDS
ncbi:excalibur calcium-binding domain-containing protein [Streptomyces massasporeus]